MAAPASVATMVGASAGPSAARVLCNPVGIDGSRRARWNPLPRDHAECAPPELRQTMLPSKIQRRWRGRARRRRGTLCMFVRVTGQMIPARLRACPCLCASYTDGVAWAANATSQRSIWSRNHRSSIMGAMVGTRTRCTPCSARVAWPSSGRKAAAGSLELRIRAAPAHRPGRQPAMRVRGLRKRVHVREWRAATKQPLTAHDRFLRMILDVVVEEDVVTPLVPFSEPKRLAGGR
jgi:hypothetical protein